MASSGQRALANLARDAIAKFTSVPHDVFLLDHGPWDGRDAAQSHLLALQVLREAIHYRVQWTHVFLMHDDSLPLHDRWLDILLSKELPAAAIVSRRSGRGQSAGTLFDIETFLTMPLAPRLPTYDVAESVPTRWRAPNVHHEPGMDLWDWKPPKWILPFSCTLAIDDDDRAFFAHLGGGTIGSTGSPAGRLNQYRVDSWVDDTREELGL